MVEKVMDLGGQERGIDNKTGVEQKKRSQGRDDGIGEEQRKKQREAKEKTGEDIEKKMRDKRYRKTEKTIQKVFFSAKGKISTKELVRRADISRSTLYRHHRGVQQILPDVERMMIGDFRSKIEKISLFRRVKVRFLFSQMLSFMRKRKERFEVVLGSGNSQIFEEMVTEILPEVERDYGLSAESEKVIKIYEKEMTGVIELWILGDFSTSERKVLKDIMYLTESARERLGSIEKQGGRKKDSK